MLVSFIGNGVDSVFRMQNDPPEHRFAVQSGDSQGVVKLVSCLHSINDAALNSVLA